MPINRSIQQIFTSQPTLEGAGVHLQRVFGFQQAPETFDPFLLLDDFRSDDPARYLAGFPWHPHRGIETITYMLDGRVEHRDSLGNSGHISAGDVQWMTAGSGIIHQEMPQGDEFGRMGGFQLWTNLPASHKMMPPRYQELKREQIPVVSAGGGAQVRVIAGQVNSIHGPVSEVITDPEYLDVSLPAGGEFSHPTQPGRTVLAYVIAGSVVFNPGQAPLHNGQLAHFGDGEQVTAAVHEGTTRFLLLSGRPLGEPIAWRGPIVMNTQEQLQVAFEEYRKGTFIKS